MCFFIVFYFFFSFCRRLSFSISNAYYFSFTRSFCYSCCFNSRNCCRRICFARNYSFLSYWSFNILSSSWNRSSILSYFNCRNCLICNRLCYRSCCYGYFLCYRYWSCLFSRCYCYSSTEYASYS